MQSEMFAMKCLRILFSFQIFVAHTVTSQSTQYNPATCTYNFVVPQNDVSTLCKSFASKQVAALEKKVDELEEKLQTIQNEQRQQSTDYNNPSAGFLSSISCACSNNTEYNFVYKDCQDVKTLMPKAGSGMYEIDPVNSTDQILEIKDKSTGVSTTYILAKTWGPTSIYCDLSDEFVGWTVIMRRRRLDVDFNRTWAEYKQGFGNVSTGGDFWIGLENIYRITTQANHQYALWVQMVDDRHIPHTEAFKTFKVGSEAENYTVHIQTASSRYSPMQDSVPFSTYDRVNNGEFTNVYYYSQYPGNLPKKNCANETSSVGGGGWWFDTMSTTCGRVNLNAKVPYFDSIGKLNSVEIKIREITD